MRIVGGQFKGRRLVSPDDQAVRPTSDRLRETLFNILAHRFDLPRAGTRVLDLFAGTGALGLEAVSRGAVAALFVETAAASRGLIRQNIEAFGLTGAARILRRDATDLGAAGTIKPFDLVFCDPPYGAGLGEEALACARSGGWLVPGAICVLEEALTANIQLPESFEIIERRTAGNSQLVLARLV